MTTANKLKANFLDRNGNVVVAGDKVRVFYFVNPEDFDIGTVKDVEPEHLEYNPSGLVLTNLEHYSGNMKIAVHPIEKIGEGE